MLEILARSAEQEKKSSEATLPEGIAESRDVRAIGKAHTQLLAAYLDIVKEVSALPLVSRYTIRFEPREHSHYRNILMWRGLIRIFVEGHMRRVLSATIKLHLLERQVTSNPDDARAFAAAADSAKVFLDQLRSWQRLRLTIAAAWPILLGLVLVALKATDVYEIILRSWTFLHARVFVATVLGLVALYVTLPLRHSFLHHRELFCPGVTWQELPKWRRLGQGGGFKRRVKHAKRRHPRSLGRNVYALEDALFDLLQTRKPREPRLDLMVGMAVTFTTALLGIYLLQKIQFGSLTPVRTFASWLALPIMMTWSPVIGAFMVIDTLDRKAR